MARTITLYGIISTILIMLGMWLGMSFIDKQPSFIPQQQSDWTLSDTTNCCYILHKPVLKRIESYSGTTNSNGDYTVIFTIPFSVAPNIQPQIPNQSATNQYVKVTSVSTTGFTINVFQRSTLTVLGIDLLSSAVTNVNGANLDVLVIEK